MRLIFLPWVPRKTAVLPAIVLAAFAAGAAAQPVVTPGSGLQATRIPADFAQPVFLAAPQGDPRLFVVEKGGTIQSVARNGAKTAFLDIHTLVNSAGERGLLGLAFDPHFASNRHFYVNYVDATGANTVIARYTVSAGNPNLADPASAQILMRIQQPTATNHKGGWIGFRPNEPDRLYIATGDGGENAATAQDLSNNLGKILRIDVRSDGFPGETERNYAIPGDNPFVGVAGNDEIFAYGFRNPFRAGFDRSTGQLYIGDVGAGLREEIDIGVAGGNYAWPGREGTLGGAPPAGNVDPLFEYAHGTLGQTVIGGHVYRGGAIPDLEGTYVFADYISGNVYGLDPAQATAARTLIAGFGGNSITSVGEDGFGALYVTTLLGPQGNSVFLIAAAVPEPGTYTLLAAGLLVLAVAGKRRKRT